MTNYPELLEALCADYPRGHEHARIIRDGEAWAAALGYRLPPSVLETIVTLYALAVLDPGLRPSLEFSRDAYLRPYREAAHAAG